ncbi:MAG: nucleotidyltransferase domain-containing protein [Chitinophagaceae bacterium]|nr:nucleotidyltransferase domain-containing protein [Chitinophagaceae bacterium]
MNKYIDIAKEIILKHISNMEYAVFLFGSRATNNYQFHSDIDIGILGEKPVSKQLISDLQDILSESIVPFTVDIVDFYSVKNAFKKEALKHIVVWNKPKNIQIVSTN